MHEYPEYPRPAVAVVVFKNERILAVRRKNPPAADRWSVPGGSIRIGETMSQAVERETMEETGIAVKAGRPFTTIDVVQRDDAGKVRFHYVIVYFLADYLSGEPVSGDDAADAAWFTPEEFGRLETPEGTEQLLEQAVSCYRSASGKR